MDEVRLAMLGDKAAQERLTARGELLPCQCGGLVSMNVKKTAIGRKTFYRARIVCPFCWIEMAVFSEVKENARLEIIRIWNDRKKLLSKKEFKALEESR